MTDAMASDLFSEFDGGKNFDHLMNTVITYELALREIEKDFYKWRLDKSRNFSEYFVWNRVKDGMPVSVSKLTYYPFLEKLRKYIKVLPKAESYYEEQRARKLSQIHKNNE